MSAVTVGIIGGTGWIGRGIAQHLLDQSVVMPDQLWIANRSGEHLPEQWHDSAIHYTSDHQALADACDVVILSVRPQQLPEVSFSLHSQLLVSVMAGVTIERLVDLTNATSVARAMPNAAIEIGESFTPWYSRYLSLTHQDWLRRILTAFGQAYVCENESQLEYFTALTGSGQGVLTAIAGSMMQSAVVQGLSPELAEQAVRQLFSGIGQLMAVDELSPQARADVCLDYAGTTAAAIQGMRDNGLDKAIRAGLDAAYHKASSDMTASDDHQDH